MHQSAALATSPVTEVRFVGCPTDGQTGPRRAPRRGWAPVYPAANYRGGLAYYATREIGVLAPAGWHCFGLQGSNGVTLIATPDRRRAADFIGFDARIAGPAVEISRRHGGTSGRFAVAAAIARYFPAFRWFVDATEESWDAAGPFAMSPWPGDRIDRRSEREVRFETPPGSRGEGTGGLLAPDGGAVAGAVLLIGEGEPDVVTVRIRAPGLSEELTRLILEQTANDALHRR